jgi:hypothetical protein
LAFYTRTLIGLEPHGPGLIFGLLPGKSYDDGDDAASGLPKRITRVNPTAIVTSAHPDARAMAFMKLENCKRVAVFISLTSLASDAPL